MVDDYGLRDVMKLHARPLPDVDNIISDYKSSSVTYFTEIDGKHYVVFGIDSNDNDFVWLYAQIIYEDKEILLNGVNNFLNVLTGIILSEIVSDRVYFSCVTERSGSNSVVSVKHVFKKNLGTDLVPFGGFKEIF